MFDIILDGILLFSLCVLAVCLLGMALVISLPSDGRGSSEKDSEEGGSKHDDN